MTKTKKILLSAIIIGIITILALTTALAIVSPFKKDKDNKNKENLNVKASYYEIDDYANLIMNYDKYSEFHIGSLSAFKSFCKSVYYTYEVDDTLHGEDYTYTESEGENYAGKTIILNADINLNGFKVTEYSSRSFSPLFQFAGVLDGKGHKISNFYSSEHTFSTALIGTLQTGGVVKNIRFENCGAYIPSLTFNTNKTYAGVVANHVQSDAVIDSCIIDSPHFKSGRYKSNVQVAPIAGDNAGTVKNCIVTGTFKIGGETDNLIGEDEGLHASYFVCATNEATNCIFTATVVEDWVTTETIGPSENDTNAFEDWTGNHKSLKSAHDAWKNGGYDECSNIPGTIEDYPNYPWFQYGNGSGVYAGTITIPLTNEQIPTYKYLRLRAFIDFTTYTIQAGEGGNVKNTLTGSVGKNTILCVPTQFEGISYTSSDGVGYASPTNYKATSDGDAIFTVETVADQYYIFDGWNDTTATFKRNKTIIQFASVTVGGTTIYDSEEIVVDYLDGEPLGDPNYDKTNHTLTYTYSVDGTPTTFVYNFADENAWTVDVTNGSAYSWDATGSAKLTITPTFKLKEYGSVWQ